MAVIEVRLLERQQLAMTTGQMRCFVEVEQRGQVGDTFRVLGVEFRIADVVRTMPLGRVAEKLWKQNGASSPEDFRAMWCALHERTGYKAERLVRVHWVEPVEA